MLKVSRVFFIIILISFLLIINCCSVFATDINMNLVPETPAQEQNSDANTDNANQIDSTTPQTSTENNSSMLNPNSVGSVQEDGLGISSILSIFLITIGIILILLAIAIIIRLK